VSFSIDRDSGIPYYIQVRDSILARVQAGIWKSGDQLPSEPKLCEYFGVSRTVIRHALDNLAAQGVIHREKGSGTFIAEPKITERLVQKLTGFYHDMVEQGHKPTTQVLTQQVIPAHGQIAAKLQLQPATPVIEIERLRAVHDMPIQHVTTYIPVALCEPLVDADLRDQSLYAFLEDHCELMIARGHRTIEAVPAGKRIAHLLEVSPGAPLIRLISVSYREDGTPIEFYRALHRGDRTRFEVELFRTRTFKPVDKILEEAIDEQTPGSGGSLYSDD
jgi:GntR family transcriptional regulator